MIRKVLCFEQRHLYRHDLFGIKIYGLVNLEPKYILQCGLVAYLMIFLIDYNLKSSAILPIEYATSRFANVLQSSCNAMACF